MQAEPATWAKCSENDFHWLACPTNSLVKISQKFNQRTKFKLNVSCSAFNTVQEKQLFYLQICVESS